MDVTLFFFLKDKMILSVIDLSTIIYISGYSYVLSGLPQQNDLETTNAP